MFDLFIVILSLMFNVPYMTPPEKQDERLFGGTFVCQKRLFLSVSLKK